MRSCDGVAHVDAEDVGAGGEQARDDASVGGGRTQRGDDLGPAQTSHQFGFGTPAAASRPASRRRRRIIGTRDCSGCMGTWSADSVSWTVHEG